MAVHLYAMEPPIPPKMEDSADSGTSDTAPTSADEPAQPICTTSVRTQLRDVLAEVSAKCCGTPLPTEMTDEIIDYCLCRDFSELPAEAFKLKDYEILNDARGQMNGEEDAFGDLQKEQLLCIKNLPGEPLNGWGPDIEDIIDNPYLGVCWAHVGFRVGWKGSGELLEFDLWSWFEALATLHGVFVFEKGSTDVLLRYEPTEFCKPVRNPDRAKELSDLSHGIMCLVTNCYPPWPGDQ